MTDKPLNEREAELVSFLGDFQRAEDVYPTQREVGDHFGWKSPAAARWHYDRIEAKGYIERRPMQSRGVRLTPKGKRWYAERRAG